jgi:hypothetical protein
MQIRQFVPWAVALMCLVVVSVHAQTDPIVVNCDQGESLNRALARMNKATPATVLVKGTCTEYVRISGFDGLTLKGSQGATLVQPSVVPGTGLEVHVLFIEASHRITISGLAVHSLSSALAGIGIGRNSLDIRLRNMTVDGAGPFGIIIFESSQVSLARVTARDPGYSTVGIFDVSDVHIEDCLFEHTTGAFWHAGLHVDSGHVTMHGTTIRNMQVGIVVGTNGSVELVDSQSYYPIGGPSDVVIENPAGTNFWGVWVGSGSSLNVGGANLRITNPGQPWGWNTGGVFVTDGGTLTTGGNGGNLFVSGSQGQGVLVSNSSHASLAGASITGSVHGGLVAVNLSTISAASSNPLTQISGNGTDLSCDSKSQITGSSNIANATRVQCSNLLPGDFENLP